MLRAVLNSWLQFETVRLLLREPLYRLGFSQDAASRGGRTRLGCCRAATVGSSARAQPAPLAEAGEWDLKRLGPDFRSRGSYRTGLGRGWDGSGSVVPRRGPFCCSAGRRGQEVFLSEASRSEGRREACLKYSGYCCLKFWAFKT